MEQRNKYQAVLFDFDGVVVNSLHNNFCAWQKAFGKFGRNISLNKFLLQEGRTSLEIARILYGKNSTPFFFDKIVNLKKTIYRDLPGATIYPDFKPIIMFLKGQKAKIGLVSGADRQRIKDSIPDLFRDFDTVLSAENVTRGKPDPEIYLNALNILKATANKTIVIENSPLGIESAKKAGCFCIAITTTLKKNFLLHADLIVSNHQKLLSLLKKLFTV